MTQEFLARAMKQKEMKEKWEKKFVISLTIQFFFININGHKLL